MLLLKKFGWRFPISFAWRFHEIWPQPTFSGRHLVALSSNKTKRKQEPKQFLESFRATEFRTFFSIATGRYWQTCRPPMQKVSAHPPIRQSWRKKQRDRVAPRVQFWLRPSCHLVAVTQTRGLRQPASHRLGSHFQA
jgi:hypothetical protein